MSEKKRTKEDEDLEYFRKKYPDVPVRKATPEEKAQHRIFIGRPPVASDPRDKGKKEDAEHGEQ